MTDPKLMVVAPFGFPTVGMIGGGQLARMTQQAAIGMGIGFTVLAADPRESAARVSSAVMIGSPDSPNDVATFARACDVVTFDHEQVPAPVLAALADSGATVRPGAEALVHAQDKLAMRRFLTEAGISCPDWMEYTAELTAEEAGERLGWPLVVKVSRGGYDGRGVWVAADPEGLRHIVSGAVTGAPPSGARWLLEAFVPFRTELAAQVARSPQGQAVAYPVVETVQEAGICTRVSAPAPGIDPGVAVQAQRVALQIADLLGVTGMLAVEMFLTDDGVLVNELAMRPHNSGHWSIDGAVTSQFENHLRAVLDLPLGSPAAVAPWAVMVNVLGGNQPDIYGAFRHCMARDPELRIHMYGKAVRPGRKIGHVTVTGTDHDDLLARATNAADYLTGAIDE